MMWWNYPFTKGNTISVRGFLFQHPFMTNPTIYGTTWRSNAYAFYIILWFPCQRKSSDIFYQQRCLFLYARLQTGRIMVWWFPSVRVSVRPSDSPSVRPSDSPSGSPSASFPHFSPTCFDTLSWNFAYDFVLLYYRSSLSVVNLRQSLWELCPF